MSSYNQATIVGNLGQDPDVRYSAGGTAFVTISVATSETWKDKETGEKKERTDWHRCKVSGRLAEICGEYLRKGAKVLIVGSMRQDKYTDKDGVERYDHFVRVDQMRMLDKREGERSERAPARAPDRAPPEAPATSTKEFEDDDLPF